MKMLVWLFMTDRIFTLILDPPKDRASEGNSVPMNLHRI
jgi:hypothetical protein